MQELVRIHNLNADFAEKLDPYVREKYGELHQGIVRAATQAVNDEDE